MIIWEDRKAVASLLASVVENENTTFYLEKYAPFLQKEIASLEKLPSLTREELVAVHPRERCFIPASEVSFVAYTSGTTSNEPLITYFSEIENYFVDTTWGMDVSRLLIVYPPLNKNFGGTFIQQCRQSPKPVMPVFGDIQNMASSAYLGASMQCDALYATPSLALALAPYIKEQYAPEAIKLLVISGETIAESKLATLQALYPSARIANLYASSEIGQFIMGPTPKMLADGVQGFRLIEKAVAAAELIDGELVVTYGQNKAFPLLRYRTGDHFTVSPSLTEKYGEGMSILQWSGRGGVDVVRVHGLEIRAGSIDDFFATLPQKISDYQVHVYPGTTLNSLKIEIECVMPEEASAGRALVEEAFKSEFKIGQSRTVLDALHEGVIESVEAKQVIAISHASQKRRVLVNHIV